MRAWPSGWRTTTSSARPLRPSGREGNTRHSTRRRLPCQTKPSCSPAATRYSLRHEEDSAMTWTGEPYEPEGSADDAVRWLTERAGDDDAEAVRAWLTGEDS